MMTGNNMKPDTHEVKNLIEHSDARDKASEAHARQEYEAKRREEFESRKEEIGIKFDKGKLRWELLPLGPIKSIIRVMQFGSEKYGDDNWKKVPDHRRRYYAAAMRHLTDWFEGERLDPETGESHLAHALCCIVFLHWREENDE